MVDGETEVNADTIVGANGSELGIVLAASNSGPFENGGLPASLASREQNPVGFTVV